MKSSLTEAVAPEQLPAAPEQQNVKQDSTQTGTRTES